MPSRHIELRSDTFTKPSRGMLEAMVAAEVGDDVWGTDPTVHALEEKCAAMFGFEAGLYVVSGTMGNQLALRSQAAPGEEVLCHEDAHIVTHERGAAAVHGQLTTRTWESEGGLPDLSRIEKMIRPAGYASVSTAVVEVENTHGHSGGTVIPLEHLKELRELTNRHAAALHCDGARIWNAHIATGFELSLCGSIFDTMSVCLSKGLGAPIGSVMLGSAASVAVARELRGRLGGGWRQAGILAAAGIYAIDNNLQGLADDHRHARELAAAVGMDPASIDTNMVLVETPDATRFVERAAHEGVFTSAVGPTTVRVVTHLDISDDDTQYAAEVFGQLAAG